MPLYQSMTGVLLVYNHCTSQWQVYC